jgi:hypothetical protein
MTAPLCARYRAFRQQRCNDATGNLISIRIARRITLPCRCGFPRNDALVRVYNAASLPLMEGQYARTAPID